MAVTKIWPVRGRVGKAVDYVENPEKTENPDFGRDLYEVMTYAANPEKTEQQYYVSGLNCVPEIARQQMTITKKRFGKEGGIVAFHAYQSFAPGEATPDQAHRIGVQLARELWGDRFEVVIATHLNTGCCHNHFVLNSVSFADGKRYNDCKATKRIHTYRGELRCADRIFERSGHIRENLMAIASETNKKTDRAIHMKNKIPGYER